MWVLKLIFFSPWKSWIFTSNGLFFTSHSNSMWVMFFMLMFPPLSNHLIPSETESSWVYWVRPGGGVIFCPVGRCQYNQLVITSCWLVKSCCFPFFSNERTALKPHARSQGLHHPFRSSLVLQGTERWPAYSPISQLFSSSSQDLCIWIILTMIHTHHLLMLTARFFDESLRSCPD